jgi:hypothetical protein
LKLALLAGFVAVAGVGSGWWLVARPGHQAAPFARASVMGDSTRLIADSVRVKIEVLNASGERGLARRATLYLRDRGFDVVNMGNADQRVDSSVVIDRSGHSQWAAQAARALGGARVESRPDSSRYLDLTILLGASFRSPAQILYP